MIMRAISITWTNIHCWLLLKKLIFWNQVMFFLNTYSICSIFLNCRKKNIRRNMICWIMIQFQINLFLINVKIQNLMTNYLWRNIVSIILLLFSIIRYSLGILRKHFFILDLFRWVAVTLTCLVYLKKK